MGLNAGLNMAGSYYAATSAPWRAAPALEADARADLVVIGGGTTGLACALHARRRGLKVILLEGGRIGWGASGRNGGQMIPGLRKGALELKRMLGLERARALFRLALEARSDVLGLIEAHDIVCDLALSGHLLAAVRPSDLRDFEDEAACLRDDMDYPDVEVLDARACRAQVDADYHGGLLDRLGGHMHPLNYALGLAAAARAAGVRLHEESEAVSLVRTGSGVLVRTPRGAVHADMAVLAGDALLKGLSPRVNHRIMPVANYVVATEPLPDARRLIPQDVAVSDSRFVVNYFRLTRDDRLLFGGGERYTPAPPRDMAAFVRPYMERVFPAVRGRRIDYAWGGLVSVTFSRLPHIGRDGPVWFAHGYSGQGVILSTLAGRLLAEAMTGEARGFDLFAGLEPPAFPGGDAMRWPLYVLGMLWYALRDRIG